MVADWLSEGVVGSVQVRHRGSPHRCAGWSQQAEISDDDINADDDNRSGDGHDGYFDVVIRVWHSARPQPQRDRRHRHQPPADVRLFGLPRWTAPASSSRPLCRQLCRIRPARPSPKEGCLLTSCCSLLVLSFVAIDGQ